MKSRSSLEYLSTQVLWTAKKFSHIFSLFRKPNPSKSFGWVFLHETSLFFPCVEICNKKFVKIIFQCALLCVVFDSINICILFETYSCMKYKVKPIWSKAKDFKSIWLGKMISKTQWDASIKQSIDRFEA